jgi:hypothetical protein
MNNNKLEHIEYINLKYLLKIYCNSDYLNEITYKHISEYLLRSIPKDKKLYIFDLKDVKPVPVTLTEETANKISVFYYTFNGFIESIKSDCLFINITKEDGSHIIERDFLDKENIFVLTYFPEYYFKSCKSTVDLTRKYIEKRWSFIKNLEFTESNRHLLKLIEDLISMEIKKLILNYKCNELLTDDNFDEHILKSTPVHSNMYINLKPLLENSEPYKKICFYLSERIIDKLNDNFKFPDFMVAPSKNAEVITSGLLNYFKKTDLIIINQVSPITSLKNYSNISSIKRKATYIIIEDFHCMGTEIKIVKGILWSKGVNVDEDVYTFPIAASDIYEEGDIKGYSKRKIYPLFRIDDDINYLMFTKNCCPVCNGLDCDHSKFFNIKSLK